LSKLLKRVHNGLFLAVAALLCVSLFTPVMTVAAQDSAAGTTIIANTGGDGATLRQHAGADAPAITTLAEGTEVIDLSAPVSGPDGNIWIQVSANGSTGFVSAAFIGTGATSSTSASSTVAPAIDAPTEPARQVQPAPQWAQPIEQGVVVNNSDVGSLPADGLSVRIAASTDAETIAHVFAGDRVEVTGPKVWLGDTPFYPVNYGNGGGFVNAYFLILDSEAVTEAPSEVVTEVATDVPTEVVTEAPAEIITEAPTEAVTEIPTEILTQASTEIGTPAPTEAVTDVPAEAVTGVATDVVTQVTPDAATSDQTGTPVVILTSIVTETPVPGSTVTPATDDNASPVATEATADTPSVTEIATEETAGTAIATTPTTDASPDSTVIPAQTLVTSAPDDASAIGSATVTGTNGEGIRCRVAADSSASTIVVLAEGTVVKVFANPDNGWLQIGCGGQLGYGNVNYLWSGGASDADINAGGLLSVSGTGGGLNCRTGAGTTFPVITTIADGTAVSVRGQSSNGWIPVTCGGQQGFVSSAYISVSPITGGTGASASGTGTISGTGGDGVRCRTGASTTSSVILVVGEGTTVTIRGTSSNGWTPVTCGGQDGYISSQFVTGSASDSTKTPPPAPGGGASTGSVSVSGSGGGVNCRSGAGLNFAVVAVVADGATVATRSGSTNGWQAVTCGGQNGFILQELTSPATGSGSGSTPTQTPAPGSGSGVTGTAIVTGTGGDGVRCRVSAPSGNLITVLPEGATVSLRGSASGGWQPVVCGGQNGFVSSQYLSTSGGGSTAPTPTPTQTPGNGSLMTNDHAMVDANLNLRYSPSVGSGVAIVVPSGIVVLITGSATSGFYPVNYDGLTGYMSGDYLTKTSAELSKRGGSGDPGTTPAPAPGGGGSATGSAMVDFAMGYLGYPYVWATHGPSSFDCSGFTYWVTMNVMGIDIGTGTWTQSVAGSPVSRANLQPGDLVFFQNTYASGLSHVGIYIGNDQFIHAENETTGVKISDLNSQYYSSRWYGAVRLG
jgi:uncharacterized protein YgiM (DUF1202 family)